MFKSLLRSPNQMKTQTKSSFVRGERPRSVRNKHVLFTRVSSNTIDGTPVSVWEVARKGPASAGSADGYFFTATVDRKSRPVPPAADAHRSFDKKWALDYLRRQLRRAV
jgi:hypothetical protein